MNGLDPWAYLKALLLRLPGHLNSRIDELLPRRWQPAAEAFTKPQWIPASMVELA